MHLNNVQKTEMHIHLKTHTQKGLCRVLNIYFPFCAKWHLTTNKCINLIGKSGKLGKDIHQKAVFFLTLKVLNIHKWNLATMTIRISSMNNPVSALYFLWLCYLIRFRNICIIKTRLYYAFILCFFPIIKILHFNKQRAIWLFIGKN